MKSQKLPYNFHNDDVVEKYEKLYNRIHNGLDRQSIEYELFYDENWNLKAVTIESKEMTEITLDKKKKIWVKKKYLSDIAGVYSGMPYEKIEVDKIENALGVDVNFILG